MADSHFAPRIDPVQSLIFGATGRVTLAVFVDGRLSIHRGQVAGMDMQAARVQAQAQFDRLLEVYPERTRGHPGLQAMFPPTYP